MNRDHMPEQAHGALGSRGEEVRDRFPQLEAGGVQFTSADNPSPSSGSDPTTRKFKTVIWGRKDERGRSVSIAIDVRDDSKPENVENPVTGVPTMCARVYYGARGGGNSYVEFDVIVGTVISVPANFARVDVALDVGILTDPDQPGGTFTVNGVIVDGTIASAYPVRTQRIIPPGDSASYAAVPIYAKRFRVLHTTPDYPMQIDQFNANSVLLMRWTLGVNQLCPWIELANGCRTVVFSNPDETGDNAGYVVFELMV